MGLTSEHFGDYELACDCCGVNGVTRNALDMAEQFRAKVSEFTSKDTPVIVGSAYRCPEHNAQVGGAKGSQHVLGNALDVTVKGLTAAEMEVIARSCPLVHAIGRSDHGGYLHIDCRPLLPGQRIAEWCYEKHFTGKRWVERQVKYYAPK